MEISVRFRCCYLRLPMNYQYNVQSMIYRGLSEDHDYSSFLHDSGYSHGSRQFRLFTFSRILGRYRIEERHLVYPDSFSLSLRSIDERMIRLLSNGFFPGSKHELCGQMIVVQECNILDYHITTDAIDFKTCSPIVAYRTFDVGGTHFYSPQDTEFYELLSDNAERKWASYYHSLPPGYLEIYPIGSGYKKVVTEYKGSYITGWMGAFRAEAPASLLDFLYQAGFGPKTSQGFGMIDVGHISLYSE